MEDKGLGARPINWDVRPDRQGVIEHAKDLQASVLEGVT
jgi:hypothetical protein